MKKRLDINGMICDFCASEVKETLLSLEGVVCAKAIVDEAAAYVKFANEPDPASLAALLDEKGYELIGLHAIEDDADMDKC